ncbi:MAG: arginine--tRNA ligase [Oceanospirillales bacterium]|jgi:arginyl-tRNA synthetase|nr:arginine--tRNA ligase [Oceanospirillales bacterium]MCH1501671.1 arginine--tRNA ligase [Litorivicinaceae bacterium]
MKDAVAALFEQALDQLIADNIINSIDRKPVQIENTRDPAHGDLATNVAMMHAKAAQIAPRALAEKLIEHLPASETIAAVDIAGPGFINIRLAKGAAFEPVVRCLTERDQYGLHPTTNERVQVEYVSANPTGPLHVGHGRGAAYGATLVNLLKARGHQVEAEYYVNDAGRQMNILAVSVYLRYLETSGEDIVFPSAGYQGQYIAELGDTLHDNTGNSIAIAFHDLVKDVTPDSETTKDAHIDGLIQNAKEALGDRWNLPFNLALHSILDDIQDDLSEFGANFDQWFSEKSLVTSGEIDQAIATLEERGYLFEQDGALWFRSTDFGDDKDRVVRRDNGETTYFASDIAYIANKFSRGFDRIIYVWGADHHGYIVRIKAAAEALGFDPERLTIRLVQFAILYKEGERLQMSTRSGSFVTLRELRDDVGRDACRYFYVMRKADQHLDFDLSLATSQTKDNPVYYVQYAHARICRVLEGLNEIPFDASRGLNHLTELTTQDELDLATAVGRFPEVVAKASDSLEAHLICYYLQELAADFHRWYNGTRLLVDDLQVRDARLALATAVQIVIRNGLDLLGVSAPRSM